MGYPPSCASAEHLRTEPHAGLSGTELGLAIVALIFAVANLYFGRSEFGAYDLSVLIDSGWRIMSGQVPTAGFVCTLPPSFYLLAAAAFRVFGLKWMSAVYAESLLYLVLCFLGLRLCQLLRSAPEPGRDRRLPLIYIAAQSLPLLSVNHLWHSSTAAGVAVYGILATYTWIRLVSRPGSAEACVHTVFAFAFLLLCKPNTAWPAVLLCFLCLISDRRLRQRAIYAAAGAVAADILLLMALGIGIFNAFYGYLGLGNRAALNMFFIGVNPDLSIIGLMNVVPAYLLLLPLSWAVIRAVHSRRAGAIISPEGLLALSAAIVSLLGLGTNWELKIVDMPPLLVGVAILAATCIPPPKSAMRPVVLSATLLVIFAGVLGFYRVRMIGVGPWAGPAYGATVRIHDSFFGDFITRRSFAELLSETDSVVVQSRGRRIFFGPRLEFLYARDGLASPVHLPIWWHKGTSYALAQEPQLISAWQSSEFDVLLFAKKDRPRFPEELTKFIDSHYTAAPNFQTVDVFYRNGL